MAPNSIFRSGASANRLVNIRPPTLSEYSYTPIFRFESFSLQAAYVPLIPAPTIVTSSHPLAVISKVRQCKTSNVTVFFVWFTINFNISLAPNEYVSLNAKGYLTLLILKASALSLKNFISPSLLKLSFSFSLCTFYLGWMTCLISFERCQSSFKKASRV